MNVCCQYLAESTDRIDFVGEMGTLIINHDLSYYLKPCIIYTSSFVYLYTWSCDRQVVITLVDTGHYCCNGKSAESLNNSMLKLISEYLLLWRSFESDSSLELCGQQIFEKCSSEIM